MAAHRKVVFELHSLMYRCEFAFPSASGLSTGLLVRNDFFIIKKQAASGFIVILYTLSRFVYIAYPARQ